jgi:hypothetical protein
VVIGCAVAVQLLVFQWISKNPLTSEAGPSHVVVRPPFDRFGSVTAVAQLTAVIDLQWPEFAAETVTAMFLLV